MLFTLLLLTSAPLQEEPLATATWSDGWGWTVVRMPADACLAVRLTGEESQLGVFAEKDKPLVYFVGRDDWGNARSVTRFTVAWRTFRGKSLRKTITAPVTEGVMGTGLYLQPSQVADLIGEDSLRLYAGKSAKGTPIATFSLVGGSEVRRNLAACVRSVIAERAPREPLTGDAAPQPVLSVADYVGNDDYPSRALRAGEQGSVGYQLTIGANGVPDGCTIVASSGSATLDTTTCDLLRWRARFVPKVDADGAPVRQEAKGVVRWVLPL